MIEDYSYEYWKMLLEDVDNVVFNDIKTISLIEECGEEYSFPISPSIFKLSNGAIKVMSID